MALNDTSEIHRPYWQTEPCPPWCVEVAIGCGHRDNENGFERACVSGNGSEITLTTMDAWVVDVGHSRPAVHPTKAAVYLLQEPLEERPRVRLHTSGGNGKGPYDLTLKEARELAEALVALVELAEVNQAGGAQ